MDSTNGLKESEIHALALIYAQEKLSRCLAEGPIEAEGMQDPDVMEIKFILKKYNRACTILKQYDLN